MADVNKKPERLRELERWIRRHKPEELFDDHGRLIPELKAMTPEGNAAMSANPHTNAGAVKRACAFPIFTTTH